VSARTVLGGALLGLGAYVNRACVFGAIARLGSGEWSYIATPVGFYAGCVALAGVDLASPARLASAPPALAASPWLAAALVALPLVIRAVLALRRRAASDVSRRRVTSLWSPHTATLVIGITFLVLFLLVGAWSYTDALAELAHGMAGSAVARTLLFAGLLGGAVLGGWTAGRLRRVRLDAGRVLLCFAGGALMAWGTLLIPGGNDGLILLAMPLLWPYAWLAFAVMCVTIGAALTIERAIRARLSRSAVAT
jgi:toxin CptA